MAQGFWIFRNHQLEGPWNLETLRKLPGFTLQTQICREGDNVWGPASQILEIRVAPALPKRAPQPPVPMSEQLPVFNISKPVEAPSFVFTAQRSPVLAEKAATAHPEAQPLANISAIVRRTGDFIVSGPSPLVYQGTSKRTFLFFLALSLVSSVYWCTSAQVHPTLYVTVPIPMIQEYIPLHVLRPAKIHVKSPQKAIHIVKPR